MSRIRNTMPLSADEIAAAAKEDGGWFVKGMFAPAELGNVAYITETVCQRETILRQPAYYYWEETVQAVKYVWQIEAKADGIWQVHTCTRETSDITKKLQKNFQRFIDDMLVKWNDALASNPNADMEDFGIGWIAAAGHIERHPEDLALARAKFAALMEEKKKNPDFGKPFKPTKEDHRQPCFFDRIVCY